MLAFMNEATFDYSFPRITFLTLAFVIEAMVGCTSPRVTTLILTFLIKFNDRV